MNLTLVSGGERGTDLRTSGREGAGDVGRLFLWRGFSYSAFRLGAVSSGSVQ